MDCSNGADYNSKSFSFALGCNTSSGLNSANGSPFFTLFGQSWLASAPRPKVIASASPFYIISLAFSGS